MREGHPPFERPPSLSETRCSRQAAFEIGYTRARASPLRGTCLYPIFCNIEYSPYIKDSLIYQAQSKFKESALRNTAIINIDMARNEHKKVLQELSEAYENVIKEYSLNKPQGHTGGPHYDSIEDLFAQRVERISDHGDAFDVSHFEDLKPYIANWDTLLEIIDEENTEGFSERWEEVRFKYGPKGMRSEDQETQLSETYRNVISEGAADHLRRSAARGAVPAEFDASRHAPEHSDSELHPATRAAEGMIGADVMWDGQRKRGIVDEVDIERGIAVVTDHEGNEHYVDLGDFDVVLDPNTETPGELKHHYGIEDAEEFDGPGMQWDGIDDPLPGSLGPKVTPTHKPYVSSYTSNDGKKVFDVLDSNGQPVFRTHSKLEAHKWFKTNYENL